MRRLREPRLSFDERGEPPLVARSRGRGLTSLLVAKVSAGLVACLAALWLWDTAPDRGQFDDPSNVAALLSFAAAYAVPWLARGLIGLWVPRRRRPPVLTMAPSGAPAVGFPRSRAWLATIIATAVIASVGWTGVTLVERPRPTPWLLWAFVGALVATALLVVLPVLLGRVRAGGIWLTPDGIESHHHGRSWSVPWDDILYSKVDSDLLIQTHPDAPGVSVRRAVGRLWGGLPLTSARTVTTSTRLLRADPLVAGDMIDYVGAFPDRRSELGTPSCLFWDAVRDPHPDDRWLTRDWRDMHPHYRLWMLADWPEGERPPPPDRVLGHRPTPADEPPRTVGGPRRED